MRADPDAGGDDLDQASIGTAGRRLGGRPRAATRRPRWGLFAGLAGTILVADQLTKAWIVANIDPARPTLLAGDYLRLIISHNNGALFGLFQGQAMLFALASFAVIVLIVVYQARTVASLVMSVALGLLLVGAYGNGADRLGYAYVVALLYARAGRRPW